MIKLGEYQILTPKREMPQGVYLEDEEGNEVLLPRGYVTPEMEMETEWRVFVYVDSSGLAVATTETPHFTIGQFAYLFVTQVNDVGAFCDWGINKELFVPFRNQASRLLRDERYVVYMYLDEQTQRLVGSTKLNQFLKKEADESLQMGQEVELLVYKETELGFKVIVDQTYDGLVYLNETPQPLRIGQTLTGYLKPIREDRKLDISLTPVGHQSIEPNAQKILEMLERKGGFLPFHDKSDPKQIRAAFGISKKLFKKATGTLYKQQLVELKDDGIHLK